MAANLIETDEVYDIDYIDASGSGRFGQCPAKYLFERVIGLENQDRSTVAVDYGTDMHTVFPLCYGAKSAEEENELLDHALAVFRQLRRNRGIDENEIDKKHSINHTINRLKNFQLDQYHIF